MIRNVAGTRDPSDITFPGLENASCANSNTASDSSGTSQNTTDNTKPPFGPLPAYGNNPLLPERFSRKQCNAFATPFAERRGRSYSYQSICDLFTAVHIKINYRRGRPCLGKPFSDAALASVSQQHLSYFCFVRPHVNFPSCNSQQHLLEVLPVTRHFQVAASSVVVASAARITAVCINALFV